jgi:hypothetical protein
MSTYNSSVVVIGEDGTEITVTANLRTYRNGLRTSWNGTLTAKQEHLVEMANWDEGRLRVPDGKEAKFLRPDRSEWFSTGRMQITGQGDPPF